MGIEIDEKTERTEEGIIAHRETMCHVEQWCRREIQAINMMLTKHCHTHLHHIFSERIRTDFFSWLMNVKVW